MNAIQRSRHITRHARPWPWTSVAWVLIVVGMLAIMWARS
jgi:hypothetical protein